MGRTVPSFRTVLGMEKEEWKPFRNALSKSDRKKFDEMWDIPKWYISACSNSVQYIRLHPILMSILLYDLITVCCHRHLALYCSFLLHDDVSIVNTIIYVCCSK